jgi:hypothetical protein
MPFVTLPCAPLCIPSNLPLSHAVPTKMPLGHRKPQLVGWSHPARQSAFFSYLGIIHCSSCSLPGSLHPETSRPLPASGGGWLQLPRPVPRLGRGRRVLLWVQSGTASRQGKLFGSPAGGCGVCQGNAESLPPCDVHVLATGRASLEQLLNNTPA